MAMDAKTLANLAMTKIKAKGFVESKENKDFVESICEAVVEHILAMAEVNTIVNVTTPQGPGTGTGVGKVS